MPLVISKIFSSSESISAPLILYVRSTFLHLIVSYKPFHAKGEDQGEGESPINFPRTFAYEGGGMGKSSIQRPLV